MRPITRRSTLALPEAGCASALTPVSTRSSTGSRQSNTLGFQNRVCTMVVPPYLHGFSCLHALISQVWPMSRQTEHDEAHYPYGEQTLQSPFRDIPLQTPSCPDGHGGPPATRAAGARSYSGVSDPMLEDHSGLGCIEW